MEEFNRTDDFSVSAPNRTDHNLNGNFAAASMVKVNIHPTRTPILYGSAERALSLTLEASGAIELRKKIVATALP